MIDFRLQLTEFHAKEYIETLESYNSEADQEILQKYGLGKCNDQQGFGKIQTERWVELFVNYSEIISVQVQFLMIRHTNLRFNYIISSSQMKIEPKFNFR